MTARLGTNRGPKKSKEPNPHIHLRILPGKWYRRRRCSQRKSWNHQNSDLVALPLGLLKLINELSIASWNDIGLSVLEPAALRRATLSCRASLLHWRELLAPEERLVRLVRLSSTIHRQMVAHSISTGALVFDLSIENCILRASCNTVNRFSHHSIRESADSEKVYFV